MTEPVQTGKAVRFVDELSGSKPMSPEAQKLSEAMGRYEEMDGVYYEALAVRTKERDAAIAELRVWRFLTFVLALFVTLISVWVRYGGI